MHYSTRDRFIRKLDWEAFSKGIFKHVEGGQLPRGQFKEDGGYDVYWPDTITHGDE